MSFGKSWRKSWRAGLALLVIVLLAFSGAMIGLADDAPERPTDCESVERYVALAADHPEYFPGGNTQRDALASELPAPEDCTLKEFKINQDQDGLETGLYTDPETSFMVYVWNDGDTFTWKSMNYRVMTVFAKGGPNGGNLYMYYEDPFGNDLNKNPDGVMFDCGLKQPGGGWSHITFYFCEIEIEPELTLTKTGDDVSKEGDTVTYDFVIKNTGNVTLEKVSVIDDVIGDLTDDFPDILAPEEEVDVSGIEYEVQEGDPNPLVNIATAVYHVEGIVDWTVSASDSHSVELVYPGLAITKEADTDVSKEGDPINYTVVVSNTGDVDLEVVVDDSLEGILWDDILPAGASGTFEYEYIVPEGASNPLVNTVTAVGTLGYLGLDNVIVAEVTHEMDLVTPEIQITKTVNPTYGMIGDVVTYTITVTNTGDWGLENIMVNDTMFGDITALFGFDESLMPNESETAEILYTIDAADVIELDGVEKIVNTADVYANPVGLPNDITDEDSAELTIMEPESDSAWARMNDEPTDFTYKFDRHPWFSYLITRPSDDIQTFYFYSDEFRVGEVDIWKDADANQLRIEIRMDDGFTLIDSKVHVMHNFNHFPRPVPFAPGQYDHSGGHSFSIDWEESWNDKDLYIAVHGNVSGFFD